MKVLTAIVLLIGLLSATAADAGHRHHRHAHTATPMPRERPVAWKEVMQTERGMEASAETSLSTRARPDIRPQQAVSFAGAAIGVIAWWPSTSPWRADEAFSRAGWTAGTWQEVRR